MTFSDAVNIVAPLRASPFLEINEAGYHADPCEAPSFSASIGKVILERSPLHAYLQHPRLGGAGKERDDATPAMEFGTACHKLILGCGSEVVSLNFKDYKSGAAQAARDEVKVSGRLPLLAHRMARVVEVEAAFRAQLHGMQGDIEASFNRGQSERVIVADFGNLKSADNGRVFARGMLDRVLINEADNTAHIWDVKTTADASPVALNRRIIDGNYDMQMATYEWLLESKRPELAGRITSTLLFIETEAPFALVPVQLDGSFRSMGRSKLGRAWDAWQLAIATGIWPSYTKRTLTVSPPTWALSAELDKGVAA